MMLDLDSIVLVIVDIQVKLAAAMYEREELIKNAVKIVQGAQVLGIPIIHTEQNPRGLGPTVPEIADLLEGVEPVTKLSFSCCGEKSFSVRLEKLNRNQILIAGMEAHVCVYQTAADLVDLGYEVQLLTDCVSSRTAADRAIGWERVKEAGGSLTSAETALFELLKVAEGDKFKQMLKVVK